MACTREWKWNPKTKGSGIITCIPQTGRCPNNCPDCFFQSGRSYLEPLEKNLPHVPNGSLTQGRVVRINDGNDSNIDRNIVEDTVIDYNFLDYFFNTAIPEDLGGFSGPVVLTVNPGVITDRDFYRLESIPDNLMFVRVRTNLWNEELVVNPVIDYYANGNNPDGKKVPVVLTFMAYYAEESIPEKHRHVRYIYRERTVNSYWAITTEAWELVMVYHKYNHYVYSCGKTEGELGTTKCSRCGNCIREYYNAKERTRE